MVSLCGIISGLTITDDQHPIYIYIYMIRIYSLFCFPIGFHERRLSVSGSTSNLRCLGEINQASNPPLFPKVKTSKYTWYSFLPKNLWEQLHKLGLSSEKKLHFFFFASSGGFFCFFQRYMIYSFLRKWALFSGLPEFYGTIWTGKTC